jgi:cell pole-organizing protein PopZ
MNKPAPKEPSMDEILSSIRQIIADDDATVVPRKAVPPPPTPMNSRPAPIIPPSALPPARAAEAAAEKPLTWDMAPETAEPEGDAEDVPFALSAAQIVDDAEVEEQAPEASFMGFDVDADDDEREPMAGAMLVDPDDIAFEPERDLAPEPAFEPMPEPEPEPMMMSRSETVTRPLTPPSFVASRPMPTPAQTAPMPDPMLSTDIASQLIEPATDAAVRHTFSKLNNLGFSNQGLTIDAMVRDMLRPLLKEWLDENLPHVVERMVEKEIARISRGAD